MKKTKRIVAGVETCPKCKHFKFEIRLHDLTSTKVQEKLAAQPFYFSEWRYCTSCGYTFVEERFKVFPDGSTLPNRHQPTPINQMLMEEHQNRLDLFRQAHGL